MTTKELFAQVGGDFKAVIKLLRTEEQKYEPGDEDVLYRLYRVAFHFCGTPTEEMCESADFVNMILKLTKLSQHKSDPENFTKKLFVYIEEHRVGYRCAKRYQREAAWLLRNCEAEKAVALLQEGLRRGAQPEEMLRNCIKAHTDQQAIQRSPTPAHATPARVRVTRTTGVPRKQADTTPIPPSPSDKNPKSRIRQDPKHHKASSSTDPGHLGGKKEPLERSGHVRKVSSREALLDEKRKVSSREALLERDKKPASREPLESGHDRRKISPRPLDSDGYDRRKISPRPLDSEGYDRRKISPRPLDSDGYDRRKISPRPLDSGGYDRRKISPRPLDSDGKENHQEPAAGVPSIPDVARVERDDCSYSGSSDSDSSDLDNEPRNSQLSPIAEHVASQDTPAVKYGTSLGPPRVSNHLSRSGQCTPRDAPVLGSGNFTPLPQNHNLRTPSAYDNKAQTPAHERHIVYVNERPYTKIKVIGRGGSCKVYKVSGPDNDIYALKRVCAARKAFDSFRNEVNVLEQLRGKENIIQMIEYEIDEPSCRISIVLEYGEYDFANYLMSDPLLGIEEIRGFWRGMLLAVQDIHKARIVHSDLKPQNYMLVRGKLKLIDFGIAKDIPNDTTNIQRDQTYGTLSYMAPEANARNGGAPVKLGRSSDIWSLGIILYQLVYKRPPFEHLTPLQRYLTLSDPNTNIEFRDLTERDVPSSNEEDRRNLVRVLQSCLLYNPRERFTIPQLLRHPLLFPRESSELNCIIEQIFYNTKKLMAILRNRACQQNSPDKSGNALNISSADVLEDQVCATLCSNIVYPPSECDTDPFERFAQLCVDSAVRNSDNSSSSKTSPEGGSATLAGAKRESSPDAVDRASESRAVPEKKDEKFHAQRVLNRYE